MVNSCELDKWFKSESSKSKWINEWMNEWMNDWTKGMNWKTMNTQKEIYK